LVVAFSMISSAVLVQTNGSQRSFQASMKRSMAAMSSVTESKLPRRMAWRVMMPKKTSTRLSHDPEVRSGGEVQRDPFVVGEPGFHGGCLWVP
jgi:hypothetical protein